ncbi:RECQ4 helicase, partial [Alaudala cheleensis]|nr:RECQ4 helicase [Alaudala cheleensis]
VHCISQWSHNFRPAYLRICKVLRERLGVRCFLGLTATATAATARDVAQHLGIPPENGIAIGAAGIPENLRLSVSMDPDRDQALLWLLGSGPLAWAGSVLVYCTRREESERLAELIRRELPPIPAPEPTGKRRKNPGKGEGKTRERGGKSPGKGEGETQGKVRGKPRERGGENPRKGEGKGMGKVWEKPGKGGEKTEGKEILGRKSKNIDFFPWISPFCSPQDQDLLELRRHIHENSVDFLAVKTLILRVFAPCKCLEIHGKTQENSKEIPEKSRICRGHERSIPIQEFVEALDLREEGIETLLCLLELHPSKFLQLFPPVHSRCRLRIPGNSPERLREAALGCPPLGFLLARGRSGTLGISGSLEFDAVALSDSMGWEFQRVRESLRRLQWESRRAGKGSGIQVEFQEFSFHFRALGDLSPSELDSLCEFLHSQILARETSELRRLRSCFRTFRRSGIPRNPQPSQK